MTSKVGVLLPASRMFPGVDSRFLAGLRAGLGRCAAETELHVELTGQGAVRDLVEERARSLILRSGCDVVTGVLGAPVAAHVAPVFSQNKVPMLVCDLGADLPLAPAAESPWLFWNSLNLWQSMVALGSWAGRELGSAMVTSAGFHEAGYGLLRGFTLGFELEGGRTVGVEVTHRETATEDPSPALARLKSLEADFFLGLYSGREGVTFVRAYQALGLDETLPLLASPLMAHGHWLPSMGPGLPGCRAAASWAPGLHPQSEARFMEDTGAGDHPAPDVFALLGYEAGLAIGLALEGAAGSPGGRSLRDSLEGVTFTSPRGPIAMGPEPLEVPTTDHLLELWSGNGGAPGVSIVGPLPLPEAYGELATQIRSEEMRSGWLNPYLVN